ncbi:MAG: serine/threonine protein kinase [Myxococcota bacterium]|nr:serine/threonine protein kinase [Myxococcota bacterium]
MLPERTPHSNADSDEARAFLQARVALFWKVLCFFMLGASLLGSLSAFKTIGADLIVDVVLAVEAGLLWRLALRGRPSVRFLRTLEVVGLLVFFSSSSFLPRYVLIGFLRDQAVATGEGAVMADAYLSSLGLVGSALMITIRAALVPSSPRRTLLYTALAGAPTILTPTFVTPDGLGGLTLRALDSAAFPWLPAGLLMVWGFTIATCTVVSTVIFGLRRQVREAKRLGQYVLERKIGEGGMGEVYRAWHGMMRRPTALKLLRPDHASDKELARFEREVQLTARLTHPNTITLFDYGRTDDGVFYYAMELLDGATLQRIVESDGPQSPSRVMRILRLACGALAEAHGIGLIHRDIKPANMMLCRQGGECDVLKLLDFGLVKELAVERDAGLSVASTLIGTPLYMAPESITAPDSVDARGDIYALGAVAYFLLAGGEVFRGQSLVEVCGAHLHREPEPFEARGVNVPVELEAIVRACLEKKPERRPQSAAELRQRLEACTIEPWGNEQARRWWLEHPSVFSEDAAPSVQGSRTIAVVRS